MDISKILGYTEANIKSHLSLMQAEDINASREDLLEKNFEKLVSLAVLSGVQKYHDELRKQLLEIRHFDIGSFNL